MKVRYITLLLFQFLSLAISSQGLKGVVTDGEGKPVAFANVCVINKTDSSFIMGCTCDADGRFILRYNGNKVNRLIRVSCVGYENLMFPYPSKDSIAIILHENAISFNEVLVKGRRPLMKMMSGELTVNIENTIYSGLGSVVDVLSQMPLVTTDAKGSLTVIGHGKPLVYVDKRLITDPEELRQLMGDRIKTISINTNPSGKYPSGTQSVINITTSKMRYEGFGGVLMFQAQQRRKMCPHGILNLNYNMGKHHLFLSTSIFDYPQQPEQNAQTTFTFENTPHLIQQEGWSEFHEKKLYLTIGENYHIAEDCSIGAKIQYMEPLNSPYNSYYHYQYNAEPWFYTNLTNAHGSHYYINAYFIDESSPKYTFGIDGTVYYTHLCQTTDISETSESDDVTHSVHSSHKYNNNLYSLRAWGEIKSSIGKIEYGAEYNHTRRHQEYNMFNLQISNDLPSNMTKSIQNTIASYIGLSNSWKRFSFNANLRVEHVKYDYLLNGIRQENDSRNYFHLLPSLSIDYKQNGVTASLSYNVSMLRPSYSAMKSDIIYNSKFEYEGGNQSLKPAVIHQLALMGIYKDLLLTVSYSNIIDGTLYYSQLFKNKPIIFTSYCNNNWKTWKACIVYSPVMSCWRPTISLNYSQQILRLGDTKYSTPIVGFEWKNLLTLKDDWLISLQLEGYTSGNEDLYLRKSRFSSDLSVKKSIKNFDVQIGAIDILNQNRERYETTSYGIHFSKWSNPDIRCIYLRLVYRFNSHETKYKGDQSGRDELKRL